MRPTPEAGADTEGAGNPGLFSALRNMSATLVAAARTRIELARNDLEIERLRLVRTLILGLAALFCLGVGLLLVVALIVLLNWENRVVVLAVLAAVFLGGGGLLYAAMQKANRSHQAFSATLSELEEDIRQLRAAAGNVPPGN